MTPPRDFRPELSALLALLAVVAISRIVYAGDVNAIIVATLASALPILVGSRELFGHLADWRLDSTSDLRDVSGRVPDTLSVVARRAVSQLFYGAILVGSVALVVVSVVNLFDLFARGLSNGLSRRQYLAYHVVAPLLAPVTYVALMLKVRAHHSLHSQKRLIRHATRLVARQQLAIGMEPTPSGWSGADVTSRDVHFSELLTRLCAVALQAASVTGLQRLSSADSRAVIALILVADQRTRRLQPVAAAGTLETTEFRDALLSPEGSVPMLDVEGFRRVYNAYVEAIKSGERSTRQLIERFKRDTSNTVSMAGTVFAIGSPISFNDLGRSLVFRSEISDKLLAGPAVRQAVGIPLTHGARRLGVLVLLGQRARSFYGPDDVYWILGDILAGAVNLAELDGYFSRKGLLIGEASHRNSDEAAVQNEVRRLMNGVSATFRVPI
jgi:hypothetical protein